MVTIVEANLVEATKSNFNELKPLNIDILIECPTIKFLIKVASSVICEIQEH